jgi:hypothetical protein
MGFFSWKTMDTNKSISNNYSSRGTFKVEMLDDKGNVWTEPDYEGYELFIVDVVRGKALAHQIETDLLREFNYELNSTH